LQEQLKSKLKLSQISSIVFFIFFNIVEKRLDYYFFIVKITPREKENFDEK